MIDDDIVVAGQSADEQPGAAPEKQPDTKEQPRGKDGKFAGKEAGEQAAESRDATGDRAEDRKGWIPPQAHDAEKARRRKLQEENFQLKGYLQALQQQPKPQAPQEPAKPLPDWYSNPDDAHEARVAPLREEIRKLKEQVESGSLSRPVLEATSRQIAMSQHGIEAVQTAFEAANERMSNDPAFNAAMKARLSASDHPFGELIKWHKEQSALQRVGDDPDAYIEAEVQRRLAEAGGQPAGHAQQRAPVLPERLPADFSNARNAGGRGQPAYGGPKSLDELYGR